MIIRTSRSYRAFSDGTKTRNFDIDTDGTVRVYDPIAGHYTVCHSLSAKQQQMIRAEAKTN
jgi:hypothetical protein